jgi:protein associated with RNAse G/E
MSTIPVCSTKFDGSLHYRYNTSLIDAAAPLTLHLCPGTPIVSYRGATVATHHSLQLYWPDRLYNLHVSWYADWRPRMHYVNIATPASWHTGVLEFIDLDLDVIWRAQTGQVELDDEDEFMLHQARFGYPAELIAQCQHSSAAVQDLIARRVYPFDGSLYAWRPNGAA